MAWEALLIKVVPVVLWANNTFTCPFLNATSIAANGSEMDKFQVHCAPIFVFWLNLRLTQNNCQSLNASQLQRMGLAHTSFWGIARLLPHSGWTCTRNRINFCVWMLLQLEWKYLVQSNFWCVLPLFLLHGEVCSTTGINFCTWTLRYLFYVVLWM